MGEFGLSGEETKPPLLNVDARVVCPFGYDCSRASGERRGDSKVEVRGVRGGYSSGVDAPERCCWCSGASGDDDQGSDMGAEGGRESRRRERRRGLVEDEEEGMKQVLAVAGFPSEGSSRPPWDSGCLAPSGVHPRAASPSSSPISPALRLKDITQRAIVCTPKPSYRIPVLDAGRTAKSQARRLPPETSGAAKASHHGLWDLSHRPDREPTLQSTQMTAKASEDHVFSERTAESSTSLDRQTCARQLALALRKISSRLVQP